MRRIKLIFYLIVIIFYCSVFLTNCKRSTEPLINSSVLVIDFQKGFWGEKYIITFDHDTVFNDFISTDPYYDFAYRIPISSEYGKYNIKILDENNSNMLDTIILIQDSTFIGINYNRYYGHFTLIAYDYYPKYIRKNPNDFIKLEFNIFDSWIGANYRPVYPPDNIGAFFNIICTNRDYYYNIDYVLFTYGNVYLSRNDSLLGTINLSNNQNIFLSPGEIDTISVIKLREAERIFEPPCEQSVFIEIYVEDIYQHIGSIRTGNILFECLY